MSSSAQARASPRLKQIIFAAGFSKRLQAAPPKAAATAPGAEYAIALQA